MAIYISTAPIVLAFFAGFRLAAAARRVGWGIRSHQPLLPAIMAPLRYMPIPAFIPLLILWFGIYEKQKIAFLFLGVFVYLLPSSSHPSARARRVGADGVNAGRDEVSGHQGRCSCPPRCPEIFDSFRVMNAIAWTYVILAEAVNPEHGLGYMVELGAHASKAFLVVRWAAVHRRHRPLNRLSHSRTSPPCSSAGASVLRPYRVSMMEQEGPQTLPHSGEPGTIAVTPDEPKRAAHSPTIRNQREAPPKVRVQNLSVTYMIAKANRTEARARRLLRRVR